MVTILATALAVVSFLCLMLGWACYSIYTRGVSHAAYQAERYGLRIEELEYDAQYLAGILNVLNGTVGGVQKRVTESIQIAEAIHSHAPDVFKHCPGLAYWLHANDQFFVSLRAAAGDRIYDPYSEHVGFWRQPGREAIFDRIYATAGLPPPPNLQYPTQIRVTTATDSGPEDELPPSLAKVV